MSGKDMKEDNRLVSKVYLGDGAYADIAPTGDLVLTTENGISVQNEVYIEPEDYPRLEEFIKLVREKRIGRWK